MVSSHQNVTKLEQVGMRLIKFNAIFLFCTVVALLSMPIVGGAAYAQTQGAGTGGALGGLLKQLETLLLFDLIQLCPRSKSRNTRSHRKKSNDKRLCIHYFSK